MGIKKTLAMLSLAAGATFGALSAEARPNNQPPARGGRGPAPIEHRVKAPVQKDRGFHKAPPPKTHHGHHERIERREAAFLGGVVGGFVGSVVNAFRSKPVVETTVVQPVVQETVVAQPVVVEKTVVPAPVVVEKTVIVEKPVVIHTGRRHLPPPPPPPPRGHLPRRGCRGR